MMTDRQIGWRRCGPAPGRPWSLSTRIGGFDVLVAAARGHGIRQVT